VTNDGEFREQMKQLGNLVVQFDSMPAGPQRTAGKEIIQRLMEIHGAGLERMMNIIFESGEAGQEVIDKLGKDPLVGSLLLLYSLHPEELETRVRKAMDSLRPRLRKLACSVELLSVSEDGAVGVQLAKAGHSCGSSAQEVRVMVENAVYEFAPDTNSLEILGLEEPAATGFVALESLIGHALVSAGSGAPMLRSESAD
jgi:Fe-S cluster biogenesis protein NfuA